MSSRVDRGTADGSLCRAMKERTKRHKATNWRPFENSVRSPFDWIRRAGPIRCPVEPDHCISGVAAKLHPAHFAGHYRVSMRHEVIVKQKASIPVANKRGRPCNSSSI